MSSNFRDAFPQLVAPLERAAQTDWIRSLNETAWLFALVETAHLIFLVVLGGAVAVLNLRLLGAILVDVPETEVEAATRLWLRAGIWGAIATGVYMAVETIVTLLPSAAFLIKMIGLIAAIALSTAVSRRVREGTRAQSARLLDPLAVSALALWLVAFVLFATTSGLGAGATLVVIAGLVLVAGAAFATRGADLPARFTPTRLGALSSLLAWITVAAAGRWIGFS